MIPTPFDYLCFLVRRPALPGAAQEKEISGAAKPPPNPPPNPNEQPDLGWPTGRTSFTAEFLIHAGDATQPIVTARTVYVCIATDGSGKVEPPQILIDALGLELP